jgi:KDO2-lipid IV(A) lauroyltransferase
LESCLVYILVRCVIAIIRICPRAAGVLIVQGLANFVYRFDRKHRHIAAVNLRIAFPELSEIRRSEIARKSYQNTALNLLEISRFPRLNSRNIRSLVEYDPVSGLDNFKAAQATGKGILYLTGHFSAWELLPAAHALYGYPLSFVTRPLDNSRLDRYLRFLRESVGNRVIDKKYASRSILKRVHEKGTVGILMDQNTSLLEGIFVDFFGLPAATSTAMALLALRTDAVILPGYLTPLRHGRYTRLPARATGTATSKPTPSTSIGFWSRSSANSPNHGCGAIRDGNISRREIPRTFMPCPGMHWTGFLREPDAHKAVGKIRRPVSGILRKCPRSLLELGKAPSNPW